MIVVCGEALIDVIPAGGEVRSKVSASAADLALPGGSPFNVAVGLARLGIPVALLSRLSLDQHGELLAGRLRAEGVDSRFLVRGPEPTTLAVVRSGPGEELEFEFTDQGADRNLRPADVPQGFPPEVVGMHFGSISLVLEPGASTLEACMAREHGSRLISLDPNVRPALIPDRAAYLRRLEGWLPFTDLLKVSRADLAWLFPEDACRSVARRWLELGPALVVVTSGKDGCLAFRASQEIGVPGLQVEVVDTVGAGDAFTAGLLAWLYAHSALVPLKLLALSAQELRAALGYATAAAALTCARSGADPPTTAEVEAAVGDGEGNSSLDS